MNSQKLKVTNDNSSFITLWLEPWEADYGLSPHDEILIVAQEPTDDFYFHVCDDDKGIRVWIEGNARDMLVQQAGRELQCGHNRRGETS